MGAAGNSLLPPFSHIPVASETFEITVPEPFGLTQIRLEFEPGSSKRISVIAPFCAGMPLLKPAPSKGRAETEVASRRPPPRAATAGKAA